MEISLPDLTASLQAWAPQQTLVRDFLIAFAAAFAGAWGAQNIAERRKRHLDLLAELRETNSAVALTATVFSVLANLKEQHVAALFGNYTLVRRAVIFHRAHPRPPPFEVPFDLKTVELPDLPIDRLRTIVFEQISITGRPIQLSSMLLGTLAQLDALCDKRTECISRFKTLEEPQKLCVYFGLETPDGVIDQTYPETLEGIYSLADASMFFAWLLCIDLSKHSRSIALELRRWPWQKIRNVHRAKFASAEEKGLMPPFEQFNDWTGYKQARPPKRSKLYHLRRRFNWSVWRFRHWLVS